MHIQNSYISEDIKTTDTTMGEQTVSLDDTGEKKKRAPKTDRSGNKYSEEEFRIMPREEQLRLAKIHWMDSQGFDASGMFQFSYSHFSNICQGLGFSKVVTVIDPKEDDSNPREVEHDSIIYIEHGKREDKEVKKLTFAKDTINKIDQLLGGQLSNIERSKVIDVILSRALDDKLTAKREGRFGVAYRPIAEERLL